MSESDFEQAADVTQYGAWRAQQHRAHLEQSAANAADLEAHRPVSAHLRRSKQGLYDMTPEEYGADVAGRGAVVGSAYGGRPLERLGGTFNWADVSDSPAPALVDRRYVNTPGQRPTGESPLSAYMRARNQ